MKRPDISRIRARIASASPGPWAATISDRPDASIVVTSGEAPMAMFVASIIGGLEEQSNNATLIAHAPQDLADLCAYAQALEEQIMLCSGSCQIPNGVFDAIVAEQTVEEEPDAAGARPASNDVADGLAEDVGALHDRLADLETVVRFIAVETRSLGVAAPPSQSAIKMAMERLGWL